MNSIQCKCCASFDTFSYCECNACGNKYQVDSESITQAYYGNDSAAGASLQGNGAGVWRYDLPDAKGEYFCELRHKNSLPEDKDERDTVEFNGSKWEIPNKDWKIVRWINENAVVQGNGWINADEQKPPFKEGKDFSENVLAIVKGYEDVQVMQWVLVDGENEKGETTYGKVWANCYGKIDSDDAQWDDDYEVTCWQKIPTPPQSNIK